MLYSQVFNLLGPLHLAQALVLYCVYVLGNIRQCEVFKEPVVAQFVATGMAQNSRDVETQLLACDAIFGACLNASHAQLMNLFKTLIDTGGLDELVHRANELQPTDTGLSVHDVVSIAGAPHCEKMCLFLRAHEARACLFRCSILCRGVRPPELARPEAFRRLSLPTTTASMHNSIAPFRFCLPRRSWLKNLTF